MSSLKRRIFLLVSVWVGVVVPAHAILNASDLLSRTRTFLKDSATNANRQQFSDGQYLQWASDGQREANAQNWLIQTSYSVTLTTSAVGLSELAMPSDFVFPIRVWYQQPGQPYTKLPATSLEDLDARTPGWTSVQGVPISYFVDYGNPSAFTSFTGMGFYPAPTNVSTGPLIIYYIQNTVDLSTSNLSAIPFNGKYVLQPYASALPYYMAYRAYLTLEETELADKYLGYWVQFLLIMRQGINRQPDFNPPAAGLRSGSPNGLGGLGSP